MPCSENRKKYQKPAIAHAASQLDFAPKAAVIVSCGGRKQLLGDRIRHETAALTEAFGHRSYNLLVLGFFTCGFQLSFITIHLPPYLVDRGLPEKKAEIISRTASAPSWREMGILSKGVGS